MERSWGVHQEPHRPRVCQWQGCTAHLLGSLCVFAVIYAITSNMWLFYDSATGRPRITQILGPIGMLSIPVIVVSGMVWLLATLVVGLRRKSWRMHCDQPLERVPSRQKSDGDNAT